MLRRIRNTHSNQRSAPLLESAAHYTRTDHNQYGFGHTTADAKNFYIQSLGYWVLVLWTHCGTKDMSAGYNSYSIIDK